MKPERIQLEYLGAKAESVALRNGRQACFDPGQSRELLAADARDLLRQYPDLFREPKKPKRRSAAATQEQGGES